MKINSFGKGRLLFSYTVLSVVACFPCLSPNLFAMPVPFYRIGAMQQQPITGTISDATGPLPGVSVYIKGTTTKAVISDAQGHYAITAAPGDTLIFESIGFQTQELVVGDSTVLDIVLSEDTTQLEEVEINAGYYTVKDRERTGSISRVTAKDIEKQPVSNPLASIQGRMSGVNVSQTTGIPGGGFSIQVRGLNSVRGEGNDPLYIVNGVPFSSQSLGAGELSGGTMPGTVSPLNSINPSDIESIEVLKDADATAIYGSRGANGVVLITTKQGKIGETRYNVQAFSTVGKVARKMELMGTQQYLAMRREAFTNDGLTEYPWYAYDINGTWEPTRNTDWQKALIGGTAYINSAQASISGGSSATQFMVSGTYRRETSVFPGDAEYGKGAVHSSITHKNSDETFRLNFSADYVSDRNTLPGIDLTGAAMQTPPNAPSLYDEAGNLNWENGTFNNPLGYLNSRYVAATSNLIANLLMSYRFYRNFEFRTSLGYTDYRISENRSLPSTIYNPAYNIGAAASTLYLNNSALRSWIAEPQLNWQKQWDGLRCSILVGTTFQNQDTDLLTQAGHGFQTNALVNNLAAASYNRIVRDDVSQYRYSAIYGRLNINWKEKYMLNLTGRRDGSSRFGPGKRFANFGAVGAAWLFAKEHQGEKGILSLGKLRGSYGITGNDQIGDYQYLDTYQSTGSNYNGVIGIHPSHLFNPDFGWETNKKLEAALELGFLSDRVLLTAGWFRNRSSNQLVGLPLPATTGFPNVQANLAASVQNTGIELDLRIANFIRKDFEWTTTLNLTVPSNKLLEFPDLAGSTYASSLVVGMPVNIRKVYHYTGIDAQTGAYTFQDYNGDGQITGTDDRQAVADLSPKLYGGLGNRLRYKNWDLDFLFQFVKQDAYNYFYTSPMAGSMANQAVLIDNHYPQNGSSALVQQYTSGLNPVLANAYYNFYDSDGAISDASYIRLKSLCLTYSIPASWMRGVDSKVYVQAQNLLSITHYKGPDPENHSASALPPLRQFTLGVQLSF